MNIKKKLLVAALMLLILGATVIGLMWHMRHYQMIDFRFYAKEVHSLDLRGQEISISHYNKLRRRLPNCEILWDVPLHDARYPHDTHMLTLPGLTTEDAEALAYFTQLETLDARGCTDYALLQMLRRTYPELEVLYTVTIGGKEYAQDARVLQVDGIQAEEAQLIQYLPELSQVRLESGKNAAQLVTLTEACRKRNIPVLVVIGGTGYDSETTELYAEGITADEIQLLYFMPHLQQAVLSEPKADADSLIQLSQNFPGAKITWEKSVLGCTFSNDATRLDLTSGISEAGALAYAQAKTAAVQGERDEETYLFAVNDDYPLPDMAGETAQLIAQVEQALAYFPNAEEVLLCGAILDNEQMAAFREAHREDYKVIWSVQCGNKIVARTDTPYFMPTKYHVYYFLDEDAVNLKYCEDMICVDLGHMAISNIDWVEYMPNLTYLVLAHTQLQYIDPISTCKNLKFLELDWSPIKDNTPLKECTALEDLNMGETFADFAPIGEMTWLKNLWMVGCSRGPAYRMTEALTDTTVMVSGSATVANGWRDLPNYYAMRDAMGMYYMSW